MTTQTTMAESAPLLNVQDLVVRFGSRKSAGRPAVDIVSLQIDRGQTIGLVGESGSGKTTIGRAILGLEAATAGSIRFDEADITHASPRRRRSLGGRLRAVFQDPYSSFNPRRPIGASLAEPLRRAGISSADARARAIEMLDAVGLPATAVDRYPRQFSGGQRQRIAIARALITRPDLVICDEAVSALDLSTQAQVLNLLADLRDELGVAFLFIAHDIAVVEFLANYVIVLYRGQIMEQGPPAEVTARPRHPYTQALVAASPVPRPAEQTERRRAREESGVASASQVDPSAVGCPFASRCPLATELCRTERPQLRQLGAADVACHYATA